MNRANEESPNLLDGLDTSQFNPLDQKRFVELMLRDAKVELEFGDDERIAGKIEYRNDPKCYCIVSDDGKWIGIPREELNDVETVLDLYVNRGVEKMRFRVVDPLGPRKSQPGKGLDENLDSIVTAEVIQADIQAHRTQAAKMMTVKLDNERRTRSSRRG